MKKCRRSGVDRRSTAIMSIPNLTHREDSQKILEDVAYMLHHMDGAREYLEEVLAQAQASGFTFDKEPKLK